MRVPFRLVSCLCLLIVTASQLVAEDVKQIEGTLSLSGKPYKLSHAVAYEIDFYGMTRTVVLASDRAINPEQIKKVLRENKGSDSELSLREPHVKVYFDKSGKAVAIYAYAVGFTTNSSGDGLSGQVKVEGNQVTGNAKLVSQGEGKLQRSFDFQFNVGLLGTTAEKAPAPVPLAKLGVTGTFKGNGKEAKLAFVTARPREPFDDKPSLMLIFTEKDHSRAERPDFRAAFGDYGSALIISCHEDGRIFGCEVAHAAHSKKPFSSSGTIDMTEFQIAGGQVQGHVTTNGEAKVFDETWEVDLKFAAQFAASPKSADVKTGSKTAKTAGPAKRKSTQPDPPKPEAKPGATLNVKDLAILQGVDNVEYKSVVEHVAFSSNMNYKTLAAELAKKLDAQGWMKDGTDLIGVSAILKRKLGDAKLTIFVKPASSGSQVTIFTEGLVWDK